MSKGVSFFLGVLVGVALTGAAWFAINNSSSSFGRLTMFDERGQMLDADSFFVVSTEDNYHALAIDSEMLFLLTLSQALNINQPIQQLVYIIGNEKSNFYDGYEIKASDKIEVPPQILWVDDCTIATFGNFSASTGKAKSKKTFNISAMVAAAVNNTTVLNYRASLPEGKRNILYFDTEQSRYHCHNVIERIYKLSGLSLEADDPRLKFWGLREYTPTLRIALVDYALRKYEGVGLVIIDGLRDLMYDINNGKEATDVMTILMAWTSFYDLHIHTVLHQNKNDSNTRGHIGTELENKAETVLVISKNRQDKNISEVKPMHMRAKEFTTFAFHIDDNALPVLETGFQVTVIKPKDKPLTALDEDVHTNVLRKIFEQHKPERYTDMVSLLIEGILQLVTKEAIMARRTC